MVTLGEVLRSEREKRGITLEQVASETKIGLRILHALESDQFTDLPAAPFVRGFVNSYARFIGLDPKEILTRFNGFIEERTGSRPQRDAGHSGYVFEKREGDDGRRLLWILLGGFLFFGIIAIVVLKPSLKHKHRSHAEKLKEAHTKAPITPTPAPSAHIAANLESPAPAVVAPKTPMPSPSVSPSPAASLKPSPSIKPSVAPSPAVRAILPSPSVVPSPSAVPSPLASPSSVAPPSPSEIPNGTPAAFVFPKDLGEDLRNAGSNIPIAQVTHKAIVKADDRLWVRYRVDDRAVSQLILGKNRRLVLRARKNIWILLGDPGRAKLDLNGQGFRPLKLISGVVTQSNGVVLHLKDQDVDNATFSFDTAVQLSPLPATIDTPQGDSSLQTP